MFSVIKSLAKHSVIYGLGDLLSKSIGFILIPVYTHYLSTEEYGTLELLDLTSYIIGLLLAMGIAQSVVRYYYEYEDKKQKNGVISVAMLTIWAVSIVVLFVLFYFSGNISNIVFKSPDYSHLFNIIFITMVINLSNEIPTTLLRIQQRSVFFVDFEYSLYRSLRSGRGGHPLRRVNLQRHRRCFSHDLHAAPDRNFVFHRYRLLHA